MLGVSALIDVIALQWKSPLCVVTRVYTGMHLKVWYCSAGYDFVSLSVLYEKEWRGGILLYYNRKAKVEQQLLTVVE